MLKKKDSLLTFVEESPFCAPGRIRTLNPQSRNLVFYPVELRVPVLAKVALVP